MALSDDVQKLIGEGTCPNCGGGLEIGLVVYKKTHVCGKRCGYSVSFSEARQGAGGGGGNPVNEAPVINSISPSMKVAGQPAFTLQVDGSNFLSESVVRIGGVDRVTTYVNGAQLTAAILASDIVSVGALSITVFNPLPAGGTSDAATLTVVTPPDTTPPVISDIQAGNLTPAGATITWQTDEAATSQVEYGLTDGYGSLTTLDASLVAHHSVALILTSNTLYHYRVKSKDAAENEAVSADGTFTTPGETDTTPPVISDVHATDPTPTTVKISWLTDEAATSQVEYGPTNAYGSSTTLDTDLVTSHVVIITGLSASSHYHYRVKSKDAAENEGVGLDGTFQTSAADPPPDTTPPVISAIQAGNLTTTGATITWQTNEVATSQVEYGLSGAYGHLTTLDTKLVASHSVGLTGLTAGTLYHYRVRSKDAANNEGVSADGTFTTAATSPLLDLYGAGAYPYSTSIGPIGGGAGYVDIISPSLADYTLTTKAAYKAALLDADGAPGRKYIYLPVVIDLTGEGGLHQRSGTILYGPGGLKQKLLGTPKTFHYLQAVAAGARVTQISLEGPDEVIWRPVGDTHEVWTCLEGLKAGCIVDNIRAFYWNYAAITVSYETPRAQIHNCDIHHCARMGYGYGIQGGDFFAWANKFDWCRHAICGNRGIPVTNWTTKWNIYGPHCGEVGQAEDCHGGNDISDPTSPAGGTLDSSYNTFMNVGGKTPVSIRGVPSVSGTFHHEWFYNAIPPWALKTLIYQSLNNIGGIKPAWPWVNITAHDIWTGTTPPPKG
jgi:hypothetical protein